MKRILLVDDDQEDQFFFIEALHDIDDVSLFAIANNGQEAMDKLQNVELPDIIFMDVNMPVMNGMECLAVIMNTPTLQNIPVVILSSSAQDKEAVHKLGAKAFIKKPNDIRILRNKMKEMINMDFIRDIKMADRTFQMSFSN